MSVIELKILNYPMRVESDFITALHPIVEEELEEILEKSGSKEIIKQQLKQRIRYLEEKKENCVLHRQWFENYKNEKWLHALKVKGTNLNLRIYFSFINKKAVFLHAFLEKGNSTLKTAKKNARKRFDDINQN